MRCVSRWLVLAGAFFTAMSLGNAMAGVVVTIGQVGNDVVASISGGMGNIGSPLVPSFPGSGNYLNVTRGQSIDQQEVGWGGSASTSFDYYSGTGSTLWRNTTGQTNSTPTSSTISGSNYFRFLSDSLGNAYLGLADYAYDNSSLSGSMRFAGKTMTELGLDNFGTHTYTFGDGTNSDTVTFILQSPGPRPGLTVNVRQVGADVVATISGSLLNLGTPFGGGIPFTEELTAFRNPSFTEQTMKWGTTGENPTYDLYTGSGTSYWKITDGFTSNSPSSSNMSGASYMFFQHSTGGTYLGLGGYNYDGTPITGSMTFTGKTLNELGFDSLGTFTYNYGSGERTGFVSFSIENGGGAVPEPTSMAIFGLGALGFAYRNRRKLSK